MQLVHRRKFNVAGQKRLFVSVIHYGYGDRKADDLAKAIRKEIPGAYARVVQDEGTGCRHVFVDVFNEHAALNIADRKEFQ